MTKEVEKDLAALYSSIKKSSDGTPKRMILREKAIIEMIGSEALESLKQQGYAETVELDKGEYTDD